MANNLTLEDINNLYFWATKLEEKKITFEELESKEDILNLTSITARNSLPKEVFKLNRLEYLIIEVEDLTELPKEIGNLTNLEMLVIECPNLNELPKEIGNLTNLDGLIIKCPNLKELPKEIGNLTNLGASSRGSPFRHHVEIDCHNLNELPKEIGNLTNLLLLRISSHNLKELPKEIWNLSEFEVEFDIKNNNNKELLKYIVDSPNNENKDVELKINIKKKED